MKRKEGYLLQNVGGENILVPLGSEVINLNGIVTLNNTAKHLWNFLENDVSEIDLAIELARAFHVKEEQAAIDTHKFLAKITDLNLLQT
jgi:hypothetical protein